MVLRPGRVSFLAICGACAGIVLAAHEPVVAQVLACLGPGAVAFLILATGRYPAERALLKISSRRRRPRRSGAEQAPASCGRIPPRGGRLVAAAMAGRGPPAAGPGLVRRSRPSRRRTLPGDSKQIGVTSMKRRHIASVIAAASLLGPASAEGHISLHPNTIPAGAFATVDVRVPGEEEGAYVKKVDMQLPPGFIGVDYANVPGWSTRVIETKLATPVTEDGETIDTQVSQIVWTWTGPTGKVENGQFINFPLSVAIPDSANGKALEFRTVQTYSNIPPRGST